MEMFWEDKDRKKKEEGDFFSLNIGLLKIWLLAFCIMLKKKIIFALEASKLCFSVWSIGPLFFLGFHLNIKILVNRNYRYVSIFIGMITWQEQVSVWIAASYQYWHDW